MYLVLIAWLYVALMMALAEATSPIGSWFGAVWTFLLYGMLPMGVVGYILNTPARRRAIKARQALQNTAPTTPLSAAPDASGEAPRHPVASVREKS